MESYSPYSEPPSTPHESSSSSSGKIRQRSSRACDQCRKLRTRCNRTHPSEPCINCVRRSFDCTSEGPEHKRGPPRGYLHALEDRLQGSEALLGVILSLPDQHVQQVLSALSHNSQANEILSRVDHSAFGPSGRKLRSWLIDAVANNDKVIFKQHTRLGLANDSASPLVTRRVNIWQDELIALISKKLDLQPQHPIKKSDIEGSPLMSPMGYSQPMYSQPDGVYSEPGQSRAPVHYASSEGFRSCDSNGTY